MSRTTSTPDEIEARFPNGPKPRPPVYQFKAVEEIGWFVAVAVISVLAQELLTFDGTTVADWRTWAVALLSAAVRAAAGALIAYLGKRALSPPAPDGRDG